jgi:hypothetical protein
MASIRKEISIDAEQEDVWEALRDWGALHRRLVPGFVVDARLDGEDRIVTFFNGAVVREVLVDLDDVACRLVWSVVDGPYAHHNGAAQVFAEPEGRTPVRLDRRPAARRGGDDHRGNDGARNRRGQGDPGGGLTCRLPFNSRIVTSSAGFRAKPRRGACAWPVRLRALPHTKRRHSSLNMLTPTEFEDQYQRINHGQASPPNSRMTTPRKRG